MDLRNKTNFFVVFRHFLPNSDASVIVKRVSNDFTHANNENTYSNY